MDLQNSEPSIQSVMDMVDGVVGSWNANKQKSRFSRTISNLRRFCKTLGSHKELLKVLPEGSEYVSIFTGTLNILIKVSGSHKFSKLHVRMTMHTG